MSFINFFSYTYRIVVDRNGMETISRLPKVRPRTCCHAQVNSSDAPITTNIQPCPSAKWSWTSCSGKRYITDMHFKEGEKVKKGQKLYSIDQQQTEAAYRQA